MLRELLPVLVAGLVPIAILALIVTGTALNLVAWRPPILWTSQLGTANSGNGITAMAFDGTGIYAAGFVGYNNVVPTYMFVGRYSQDGGQVWKQQFGNPTLSLIYAVGVGADGVYIAGNQGTQGIYPVNASFVKKYDLNGNQIWSKEFGNGFSAATAIAVSTAGVFVGGTEGGGYFLKDYDFNGGLVWTRLLANYTGNISVYAAASGVYTLFAKTNSSLVEKYDSSGARLWTRTCSCFTQWWGSGRISGDSTGVYVVGRVETPSGVLNGFLGKFDFNGNQVWTTTFSAPGYYGVEQVEVSAGSSAVYLAVTTSDGRGTTMKYDSNGNHAWSFHLPLATGTGYLTPGDAIAAGDSGVYVAGDSKTSANDMAFILLVGESSSLVFFGSNPPYSFGLVALLAVVVVTSVLWLRRRLKKKLRVPSANVSYHSQKIPRDVYRESDEHLWSIHSPRLGL